MRFNAAFPALGDEQVAPVLADARSIIWAPAQFFLYLKSRTQGYRAEALRAAEIKDDDAKMLVNSPITPACIRAAYEAEPHDYAARVGILANAEIVYLTPQGIVAASAPGRVKDAQTTPEVGEGPEVSARAPE